jgi:hypothetical protein
MEIERNVIAVTGQKVPVCVDTLHLLIHKQNL